MTRSNRFQSRTPARTSTAQYPPKQHLLVDTVRQTKKIILPKTKNMLKRFKQNCQMSLTKGRCFDPEHALLKGHKFVHVKDDCYSMGGKHTSYCPNQKHLPTTLQHGFSVEDFYENITNNINTVKRKKYSIEREGSCRCNKDARQTATCGLDKIMVNSDKSKCLGRISLASYEKVAFPYNKGVARIVTNAMPTANILKRSS